MQEQYDMCYSKCVAQETDKVVAERAQVQLHLLPLHQDKELCTPRVNAVRNSTLFPESFCSGSAALILVACMLCVHNASFVGEALTWL